MDNCAAHVTRGVAQTVVSNPLSRSGFRFPNVVRLDDRPGEVTHLKFDSTLHILLGSRPDIGSNRRLLAAREGIEPSLIGRPQARFALVPPFGLGVLN